MYIILMPHNQLISINFFLVYQVWMHLIKQINPFHFYIGILYFLPLNTPLPPQKKKLCFLQFYLTLSTEFIFMQLELSQELLLVLQQVRLLIVASSVELDLVPLLGLCSLQRFWRHPVLTGVQNNMGQGAHLQWFVIQALFVCVGFLWCCLHVIKL